MCTNPFKYVLLILTLLMSRSAMATTEVKITQDLPYALVSHEGDTVRVQRIQNQDNVLRGGFAKTSRKCPPFCIQPQQVAPGVETVGELEMIDFMSKQLKDGSGLIIDARTESWYQKGTIPGSINIPFTVFTLPPDDPRLTEALATIGVTPSTNRGFFANLWVTIKDLLGIQKREHAAWNFANAKELVLWCNGMWCGQSPRAIKGLLALGYPVEKLHYYRGGMQAWRVLGLTTVEPGEGSASVARR